jgi:DNA-binding NarL/FixJ family response regulator
VVIADHDFLSSVWISSEPHFALRTTARLLVEVNDGVGAVESLLRVGCWGVVRSSASARIIAKAVHAVACGQLWLSRSELTLIVRTFVAAQLYGLTPRETEILRLVAEGCRNQEIARRLFISHETVRWHLRAIYSKLGVHDRPSAVRAVFGVLAVRDGANLQAGKEDSVFAYLRPERIKPADLGPLPPPRSVCRS